MASLKEIAPMILAGLAGASSPRGADVFTNIQRAKYARDESDRRDKRQEFQSKRLLEADKRAAAADERSKESHAQVTSMREIKMREAEEAQAKQEEDASAFEEYRNAYIEANPKVAEDPIKALGLGMASDKKQFDEMVKKYGELTTEEMVALNQDLDSQGIRAQVGKGGVQSLSSKSTRKDEGPSREQVGFDVDDLLVDTQVDLEEFDEDLEDAMAEHQKIGLTLRQLTDPEGREDTLKEYKESGRAVRTAQRARDVHMRKARTNLARLIGGSKADEIMAAFDGQVIDDQLTPGVDTADPVTGLTADEQAEVEAQFESEFSSNDEDAKTLGDLARNRRR